MNTIIPDCFELDPIEIDQRSCELCGRTIDQHECIDHGEGPEFYCYAGDDIVRLWEIADPRDRWRHTGESPPDIGSRSEQIFRPEPYRTPQSTIDAFWYVERLDDPEHLARWLTDHPRDADFLLKLWKAKQC
jgi:hypothetical protein